MSETNHAVSLRDADADEGRSWWLLPHLHDGLGDRYLSFAENGAMVEMLRVREPWASRPAFADAVRQRVRDLDAVRSPWLSTTEIVEPTGTPGSLALVSEHCATRIADVQTDDAAAALAVLEQVLFAVSTLQHLRSDVAHGAIDAARVGLVEGHVRLLEPCFGSALAALAAEGESVWGAAAPIRRVGQSADVVLCARVGIGLLTGEPFTPEKPRDFAAFDERVVARCTPEVAAWFRRAMHMDGEPWPNAQAALDALQPLLAGTAESRAALVAALETGAPSEESSGRGLAVAVSAVERTTERPAQVTAPPEPAPPPAVTEPASIEPAVAVAAPVAAPVAPVAAPRPRPRRAAHATDAPQAAAPAPVEHSSTPPPAAAALPASNSRRNAILAACVGLLVIVVAAQAVYIVRNLGSTTISVSAPPSPVAAPSQPSGPGAAAVPAGAVPPGTVPAVSLASAGGGVSPGPEAAAPPAPEPRTPVPAGPVGGWLTVPAPIEVDIFRGGELVGTSRSSRLMLPEGRHTLDLVNQEVGFRQTVVVTIAPGRESTAPVRIPDGVVHANALPWAEVFIDGNRVGETPLGNLQVPLGRHEVLFRHPTLGERRQTVVVTAGAPARISVDLRR